MKKIMFNDRYGLTQAVLEGRKTMTRRIIAKSICVAVIQLKYEGTFIGKTADGESVILPQPAYKIGDELAVAQNYKAIGLTFISPPDAQWGCTYEMPGYSNKMFVRADLMPHRIHITGIKVERLQDITEPDCIKEGLLAGEQEPRMYGFRLPKGTVLSFLTPREAFAALIDRISGRGTWQRNPWVYAYTFELIK